jgi:hypothetical protein
VNRRHFRKAAVELIPVLVIAIIGVLTENASQYGISSGGVWALLQVRRFMRDVAHGEPLPD